VLDTDGHSLAVDVGDLEVHRFRHPQPGGVSGRQRGTASHARHRGKKTDDLACAKYDRELARFVGVGKVLRHPLAAQRHAVEEAQRTHRLIHRRPGIASRREVHLKGPYILQVQAVRRPAKMAAQILDRADVSFLCRRGQIADLHVLDHAATQRAHLGHLGDLLSQGWALTTTTFSDGRNPVALKTPYRRSGLVQRPLCCTNFRACSS